MAHEAASPPTPPAPAGAAAPPAAAAEATSVGKRSRTVAVRLHPAEEAVWVVAAAADGHRQLGAWIREKAVAGYLSRRGPARGVGVSAEAVAEINALRQEMARWGNNLNQIARAVNSGHISPAVEEHLRVRGGEYVRVLARIADRLDELDG
ncbi:MobC family plasmid mobilization relaxosome protein [Rhodococcus ruber]|uniref:MobC family plasmid mobilization relaxosome protein n=1 Tax=Rhodococcus ruber TaxID=1830 RepID=UPI000C7B1575|nr:MobC family plasmid mobilization relaxosome protein [Rhodococcus ruber]AUM20076.1 hypothetical protein CSW53_26115 [Rhodococcus ruber]